ncbi:LysR family transcriptional regulator [Metapseudomonas otitidis]|uniref:LysR family transcriptional regulator n=1 Tax=Metapseudomonas otitidis TaxID=319939 RepID=UPI00261F7535|nr:LysR family transcriptional regulator [Pseudomonas otitidis]
MRFSFEQLQQLVTVAREGSFSAAARHLGRTQSTVSAAIANLEADLGVELFDRSTRIPRLTAAGERLLLEAEAVVERCLALEGHAQSLSQQIEASLRLAIEVPGETVMPVLKAFEQAFPHVDLLVRNPQQGDVAGMVQRQEIDLGVAFSQPEYPRELGFRQMGKLIMVHVCHPQHVLGRAERVTFDDLHGHRRLALSGHASAFPSSEYLRSTRLWQAENYPALVDMLRAGLGWATLPRLLVRDALARGELVELQLEAYPHTDWLVGVDLIWSRRQGAGPALAWLRERLAATKVAELDRLGRSTTL